MWDRYYRSIGRVVGTAKKALSVVQGPRGNVEVWMGLYLASPPKILAGLILEEVQGSKARLRNQRSVMMTF